MLDIKRLITIIAILIGIFILGVVYFMFNPTQHSFFISCPFKTLTGFHCAGCGSQRAMHQLLHGELFSAFRLNPLLLLSFPLIFYGIGSKIYNYIFRKTHRVTLFYKNWFVYLYFGIAILFWVLRNIPYPPFNLLAPIELA